VFSLSLFGSVRGSAGIGPIGMADAAKYNGQLLSAEVRSAWLERILREGGEHGAFGADATFFALSVGRLALQLSSRVDAIANLPADLAELALFGNAGRTGQPRDFNLAGTTFDGSATTTAALAYAQPLPIRLGYFDEQRFSLGVTVKYTVGHAIGQARDAGSLLTSDPVRLDVRVPMVTVSDSLARGGQYDFGRGIGVDVGAAWQGGPWTLGVAVKNVVNTFKWDTTRLVYRPGEAYFDSDTSYSKADERPYGEAPAALRALVAGYDYKPTIAGAAALRLSGRTTVSFDARERLGDGVPTEPKLHAGVGLEFRPVGFLPLRAGGAMLSGGWQAGGGAGIEAGSLAFAASAIYRNSNSYGVGPIVMLGATFGTH
jgi:hypothetical protein